MHEESTAKALRFWRLLALGLVAGYVVIGLVSRHIVRYEARKALAWAGR